MIACGAKFAIANLLIGNSICKFYVVDFPFTMLCMPCKTVRVIYWWECEMVQSCPALQFNATGIVLCSITRCFCKFGGAPMNRTGIV